MPESTSPSPLPAPEAGANNTNPNASAPAPAEAAGASPFPLNQAVEEECDKAEALADQARKDEYKGPMEARTIDLSFCNTLKNDAGIVRGHNRAGVQADASGKDATRMEGSAADTLVASLRGVQAAARIKHLPEHPDLLDPYLVGEKIDDSLTTLNSSAQAIIAKAESERPPGIDTNVIERIKTERAAVTGADSTQESESGKGIQARELRDQLVKSVTARRKKIQYAADQAFPYVNPANAKARSDFKLPTNRPYSY